MAESQKTDLIVGVDLGGTKILAGVFTPQLKLLQTAKLSTKSGRGFEAVVDRIARCVRDAVDEADLSLKNVKALGIGAPGAVDPETGEVVFAPNLEWKDAPLKRELEKLLGVPVFADVDPRTLNVTADTVIRLVPPLTINKSEADFVIAIVSKIVQE
jgi:glucokinase